MHLRSEEAFNEGNLWIERILLIHSRFRASVRDIRPKNESLDSKTMLLPEFWVLSVNFSVTTHVGGQVVLFEYVVLFILVLISNALPTSTTDANHPFMTHTSYCFT